MTEEVSPLDSIPFHETFGQMITDDVLCERVRAIPREIVRGS